MEKSVKNLLLLLLIISLGSCSVERRLARKYISNHKPGAVLLIYPDLVFKSSYKIPEIENFNSLSEETKDSISFYTSDIIQYCDDSIYIKNFMESLARGFKYFGYSVYSNQSADQFLGAGNDSFIINLAQMQIEEYVDSISDETSLDHESVNSYSIFITAINLNSWVEITKLNHVKHEPELLFNTQTITDDFDGHFRYFPSDGTFDFEYSIDSLNVKKLYNASATLGYRHAQWLFDYMMNDYVKSNMPEGEQHETLYSYDAMNKVLKKLKWVPFEEI